MYTAGMAQRYGDPGFPSSKDWRLNIEYIQRNSTSVDRLSPAEKYDLLVGDRNKTLTRFMISEGLPYYQRTGKVETWMGYCHGWAPASFMMPRPGRAIQT